jgi:hypothetical protein
MELLQACLRRLWAASHELQAATRQRPGPPDGLHDAVHRQRHRPLRGPVDSLPLAAACSASHPTGVHEQAGHAADGAEAHAQRGGDLRGRLLSGLGDLQKAENSPGGSRHAPGLHQRREALDELIVVVDGWSGLPWRGRSHAKLMLRRFRNFCQLRNVRTENKNLGSAVCWPLS